MKKNRTIDLCLIAAFAAIISVVSQFSIPLPGGVPVTLQTFIIPAAGVILGRRRGFWAGIVYLLLGAVGLPVFAGATGGIGIIFGMTGGFLVSFPFVAYLAGLFDELGVKFSRKLKGGKKAAVYIVMLAVGMLLGNVVNYAVGTVWFVVAAKSTVETALAACVIPFIPTAILKDVMVIVIAPILKRALASAGVLRSAAA